MQSFIELYSPISEGGGEFDPKDKIQEDEKFIDADDSPKGDFVDDKEEHVEHKSFKTSLRDALQEWSNDDAKDIEEDDSTPMRSGL